MTTVEPSSSRRRVALVAGAIVAAVILAALAWVCVRGLMAKAELEAAQELSSGLQTSAGDLDGDAAARIDELAEHAGRAAELTSDPVWRAAEVVPFAGPNLAAVRIAASEMDQVVSGAIAPLAAAAVSLSTGARTADGAIDLAALTALQAPASQARVVLEEAEARLSDVDTDAVVQPLREGVIRLTGIIAELRPAVAALDDAVSLLPPVLGAEAPRTILVALQNNAELRTGGGITGSFVELTADGGRLAIGTQADSSQFDSREAGILPLPESLAALYGDRVGRFVQNASMPADFELTAGLVSEWWRALTGRAPDVVISVDPLVLQALLRVTGPIDAAGQTLGADELVPRLLVDPYLSLDPDAQSELFRSVAATVFSRVTSADVDLVQLVSALAAPIEQGRVSMWSAHREEQELISRTALAGPAVRQALAGDDAFAVYLNDATGGKMDSLLDVGIATGVAECRADGHRDVVVSVTLANQASAEAALLPASMTGGGQFGVRPGDIATNVSVSAPPGSFFAGVTVDGAVIDSAQTEDAGFPVATARADVAPGGSATVEFRFVTAVPRAIDPVVLHTPMLQAPEISAAPASCG